MTKAAKAVIVFMWAGNLMAGVFVLAKYFAAFKEPALPLFIVGLAGVTVFAIRLFQSVAKGEIPAQIGGDLAVRSLLSSCFLLFTLVWILRG